MSLFRAWDSKVLYQDYEKALQIRDKIQHLCADGADIHELPMSAMSSIELYSITSNYVDMYENLLERDLLECGYPKSTNKKH